MPGHGGGLIVVIIGDAIVCIAEARVVAAVVNVEDDVEAGRTLAAVLVLVLVLVSSLVGQLSGLTAKHFRNNCPNKLTLPLVLPAVLSFILPGVLKGGGGYGGIPLWLDSVVVKPWFVRCSDPCSVDPL